MKKPITKPRKRPAAQKRAFFDIRSITPEGHSIFSERIAYTVMFMK
jgi:hypothetical protein